MLSVLRTLTSIQLQFMSAAVRVASLPSLLPSRCLLRAEQPQRSSSTATASRRPRGLSRNHSSGFLMRAHAGGRGSAAHRLPLLRVGRHCLCLVDRAVAAADFQVVVVVLVVPDVQAVVQQLQLLQAGCALDVQNPGSGVGQYPDLHCGSSWHNMGGTLFLADAPCTPPLRKLAPTKRVAFSSRAWHAVHSSQADDSAIRAADQQHAQSDALEATNQHITSGLASEGLTWSQWRCPQCLTKSNVKMAKGLWLGVN